MMIGVIMLMGFGYFMIVYAYDGIYEAVAILIFMSLMLYITLKVHRFFKKYQIIFKNKERKHT